MVNNDSVNSSVIQLDNFLKLQGVVQSGGEAKHLIQGGSVKVNGETDTRRKRKLQAGDVVEVAGETFTVEGRIPAQD